MIAVFRLAGISWWRFAIAAALGVVAILAGVGLLGLSGYLICRASQRPAFLSLGALVVGVRALALLRPGARYGERLSAHDLAFRALGRIRTTVYARIEPLAPSGLEQFRDGDLLSRMVSDVDELQDVVLRVYLPVVVAVPTGVLIVAGVAIVDPVAAAVVAVGLLVGATVPPAVADPGDVPLGAEQQELRADLTADLVDVLGAAEELWLNGADRAARERIDAHDAALVRAARRDARGAGAADALSLAIAGFTATAVLALASSSAQHGGLDPLLVAPLTLVALAAFEAVTPLAAGARRLPSLLGAGQRVLGLIRRTPEVSDPAMAGAPPRRRPEIALADIDVSRGHPGQPVLEGFDLHVGAGERIVVTGPSGVGKTTTLHLLVRFLERVGGTATLDAADLRSLDQDDVREQVLVLDQDPHVFNSDIRQNVALARPGASDDDILQALDRARLGDWVRSLPAGLDCRVGEGGRALSGGERQRLAMARAFLADPSVLLLDEPTAHLDAANAQGLLTDLWTEAGDRSVVLVTHGDPGPFTRCRTLDIARSEG